MTPHPQPPDLAAIQADLRDGLYVGRGADNVEALLAECERLRAIVASVPDLIRKSGEPGPGGIDITGGIPSEIYVGIGRERYESDYELAAECAAAAREEAARVVEQALAGGGGTGAGKS